jgi:inward rectifier potassium channel
MTKQTSTIELAEIKALQSDKLEEAKDLGFGAAASRKSGRRLLNPDGSFNVSRKGYSLFRSRSFYHTLLNISWPTFFLLIVAYYLGTNLFFAGLYTLCGPGAIVGFESTALFDRFLHNFFFSVQTLATIGYGVLSPKSVSANLLVTIETLIGLLGFALITGLFFSRFSRPGARILYSKHAIVAPYRGITAFEFRIINERKNQIYDLEAKVVISRLESSNGVTQRKFHELPLERNQVMFFPLNWTIVHPIDEKSPLYQLSDKDLMESDAEFLVLLKGVDDTFSQVVYDRRSYKYSEVLWGAKFTNILDEQDDGNTKVDLNRIDEVERVNLA